MVIDAWKNFEASGRIADYLNYRQCMDEMQGISVFKNREVAKAEMESRGIGNYGTQSGSDRNDFEGNASGRV